MSRFTVVEFPEENSIEVVPTKWVNFENQTCLYKDGPEGARLRRNPESIPQPEWPVHRIKVKAHFSKTIYLYLSIKSAFNVHRINRISGTFR